MKKNYENIRKRMLLTMQRSLPEIIESLDYGIAEFAERIGVTRQALHNFLTPNKDEKDDREFTRMISEPVYLAICALLDATFEDRPDKINTLRNILIKNEQVADFEVPIFCRMERWSLRRKWLLSFTLQPSVQKAIVNSIEKEPEVFQWKIFLELYNVVVDTAFIAAVYNDIYLISFANALLQCNYTAYVPANVVGLVDAHSMKIYQDEFSYHYGNLGEFERNIMDAYVMIYYNYYNQSVLHNEELNKKIQNIIGESQRLFGMYNQDKNTSYPVRMNLAQIANRKENDHFSVDEAFDIEMTSLVDIIQRLRTTYRTAYFTTSDEMAEAVMREIEADKSADKAEFIIIKYKSKKGKYGKLKYGKFTVISSGKEKE